MPKNSDMRHGKRKLARVSTVNIEDWELRANGNSSRKEEISKRFEREGTKRVVRRVNSEIGKDMTADPKKLGPIKFNQYRNTTEQRPTES